MKKKIKAIVVSVALTVGSLAAVTAAGVIAAPQASAAPTIGSSDWWQCMRLKPIVHTLNRVGRTWVYRTCY